MLVSSDITHPNLAATTEYTNKICLSSQHTYLFRLGEAGNLYVLSFIFKIEPIEKWSR